MNTTPVTQVGKQYGSAREALLLNGKFVASQLAAMAEAGASSGRASSKSAVVPVAETVFALALAAEVSGLLVLTVPRKAVSLSGLETHVCKSFD